MGDEGINVESLSVGLVDQQLVHEDLSLLVEDLLEVLEDLEVEGWRDEFPVLVPFRP